MLAFKLMKLLTVSKRYPEAFYRIRILDLGQGATHSQG